MATKLEAGRTYYGHDNQRVHVLSIDGGNAVVQWPISLSIETWPLDKLADFAAASKLRTYYAGDERRTKLSADKSGVRFKDERTREEHEVSPRKWASWRKSAKP